MSEPMHIESGLVLTGGQATSRGIRQTNEDCMGLRVPDGSLLALKGAAAVIADGVSSAEAGREASESCVQSFLADYYSTPESWTVKTAGQVVLTAINRWLYSQSHRALGAHRGHVSTLSVLILKSRIAHVFHVGDTRIYRLRDSQFECLTNDHSTAITESQVYLARAMGLDARLEVDYRALDLREGDLFLLSTDGVHDALGPPEMLAEIETGLEQGREFEKICARLIDCAQQAGSEDNLTCQLIRVDGLSEESADDINRRLTALPFPPVLGPGMVIDGYAIDEEVHASTRSQLYRVTDRVSGQRLILKTPSVNFSDDPAYIERFVMEPWIGCRITSPNVVKVMESQRPQNFLYYLMEDLGDLNLADWIAAHPRPEINEVIEIVKQISSGLRACHRKETWHADLKPANVMIDPSSSTARIVDFGSCLVAGIQEVSVQIPRQSALGTAAYSAPESRGGEIAGERGDLFALGSIAYEMLTGQLPYGPKTETARSSEDFESLGYHSSLHYNPMVPLWMDGALKRAVAPRASRRYPSLSEFLYDLRYPNPAFLRIAPIPLIERDPLRFWQGLAALLAAGWLLSLWWLLG